MSCCFCGAFLFRLVVGGMRKRKEKTDSQWLFQLTMYLSVHTYFTSIGFCTFNSRRFVYCRWWHLDLCILALFFFFADADHLGFDSAKRGRIQRRSLHKLITPKTNILPQAFHWAVIESLSLVSSIQLLRTCRLWDFWPLNIVTPPEPQRPLIVSDRITTPGKLT